MSEDIYMYAAVVVGYISIIVFLYLWLVKKADFIKPHADSFIGGFGILWMIGFVVGLMGRSQQVDFMTNTDFLIVTVYATALPAVLIGLVVTTMLIVGLFKLTINRCLGYGLAKLGLLEKVEDLDTNEAEKLYLELNEDKQNLINYLREIAINHSPGENLTQKFSSIEIAQQLFRNDVNTTHLIGKELESEHLVTMKEYEKGYFILPTTKGLNVDHGIKSIRDDDPFTKGLLTNE